MKRLSSILCILITAVILSAAVFAHPIFDTERECTMTLCYGIENVEILTYKIAEFDESGSVTLCEEYEKFPVSIYGVKDRAEWDDITATLASLITANKMAPTLKAKTDGRGNVKFERLSVGMYLTLSVTAESEGKTRVFEDFITVLPLQDGENYDYDVVAYPKQSEFTPSPTETEYKVIKQWADNGYAEHRPQYIEVEIYRNGELYETQKLSADNNWCYSWKSADDGAIWRTVEKDVPSGYTVTVTEKGSTFIITNAKTDLPDTPPEMGDMIDPTLWAAVMCLSGILITLSALALSRIKR